jgi:hypothetical protein
VGPPVRQPLALSRPGVDAQGRGPPVPVHAGPHGRDRGKGSQLGRDPGALDGVALILLAGDFCGPNGCGGDPATSPRTDGTVGVFSQLMLECGPAAAQQRGPPPTSVFVPPGLVPAGTLRKGLSDGALGLRETKDLARLTGQPVPESPSPWPTTRRRSSLWWRRCPGRGRWPDWERRRWGRKEGGRKETFACC